jgi:hypothetical protein
MQRSIKIIVKNKLYEWVINAHSFEHGILLAENLHNRLGLIGRTYIYSECGKSTWIM